MEVRIVRYIVMFYLLSGLTFFYARANGVTFTAPSEAGVMLKEGDVITFRHNGYLPSSNRPKLPVIHRVVGDLSWAEIAEKYRKEEATQQQKGMFYYIFHIYPDLNDIIASIEQVRESKNGLV